MINDLNMGNEAPERKERLFLPTFPRKSGNITRQAKKRSRNSTYSNADMVMSLEEVKILKDKIGSRRSLMIPPIARVNLTKKYANMQTLSLNVHLPCNLATKPIYISKLFKRKKKKEHQLTDRYKFMLTGANFNYLNNRILENDSSTHSIQDVGSLDAKYKHFSPEPKGYGKTMAGNRKLAASDFGRTRGSQVGKVRNKEKKAALI